MATKKTATETKTDETSKEGVCAQALEEATKQPDEDTAASTKEAQPAPKLESLSTLASRHRVPSWQQAALMRLMDWTDGKMLTDAEYSAGLERLKTRRLGGGRVA